MNLLLDQGLPRSAAASLASAGWTVVHVGELGMSRALDVEILAEAVQRDACIVTLDADFHALMAISGATKPSVIRLRLQGIGSEALASLLLRVAADIAEAVSSGALISIDERTVRVHRLPLIRNRPEMP